MSLAQKWPSKWKLKKRTTSIYILQLPLQNLHLHIFLSPLSSSSTCFCSIWIQFILLPNLIAEDKPKANVDNSIDLPRKNPQTAQFNSIFFPVDHPSSSFPPHLPDVNSVLNTQRSMVLLETPVQFPTHISPSKTQSDLSQWTLSVYPFTLNLSANPSPSLLFSLRCSWKHMPPAPFPKSTPPHWALYPTQYSFISS